MVSFRSAMNSAEKAMQHQRQHPRLRWLQVTLNRLLAPLLVE
jgi:hypothetical protein